MQTIATVLHCTTRAQVLTQKLQYERLIAVTTKTKQEQPECPSSQKKTTAAVARSITMISVNAPPFAPLRVLVRCHSKKRKFNSRRMPTVATQFQDTK